MSRTALRKRRLKSRGVWLRAVEIGGHDIVVEFDRRLDEDMPVLRRLGFEIFRDFRVGIFGPECLVLPNHGFHPHEIDDALEIGFRSKRQLNTDRAAADLGFDILDAAMEVGAGLVHLIDEDDARHIVFLGLPPNSLGLRLHALIAVEDADGAVKHPERALDLDREIDMAGRVDDV